MTQRVKVFRHDWRRGGILPTLTILFALTGLSAYALTGLAAVSASIGLFEFVFVSLMVGTAVPVLVLYHVGPSPRAQQYPRGADLGSEAPIVLLSEEARKHILASIDALVVETEALVGPRLAAVGSTGRSCGRVDWGSQETASSAVHDVQRWAPHLPDQGVQGQVMDFVRHVDEALTSPDSAVVRGGHLHVALEIAAEIRNSLDT